MRSVLINLVLILLAGFCIYAGTVGDVDVDDVKNFLQTASAWLKALFV